MTEREDNFVEAELVDENGVEISVEQNDKFEFDPDSDNVSDQINKALDGNNLNGDPALAAKMAELQAQIKNMSGKDILSRMAVKRPRNGVNGNKAKQNQLAKKKALTKKKKKLAKKNNRR